LLTIGAVKWGAWAVDMDLSSTGLNRMGGTEPVVHVWRTDQRHPIYRGLAYTSQRWRHLVAYD